MTHDLNKLIENVSYNHLNLPVLITFTGGNTIAYLYNAVGQKVRKTVTVVSNSLETYYLDGFQYSGGRLGFFPHAEGYVTATYCDQCDQQFQRKLSYVYNYTDHLGNIRLSYGYDPKAEQLKILEENHYYPFGLKHTNYSNYRKKYSLEEVLANEENSNWQNLPSTQAKQTVLRIKQIVSGESVAYNYKFQGQERQDELGLNWDSFKWRNYDYAIGRFMSVDPLATDFPQWSPYVFSGNLVTMAKELEGMEPAFLIGKDGKLSKGVISVMQAAFGYTPKSLTNTTWVNDNDPRANMVQTSLIPNKAVAVTWYSTVAYDNTKAGNSADWWFALIAHEQNHRNDISNDIENGKGFYKLYAWEAILGLGDNKKMSLEKSSYKNEAYATQLWNYNGGEASNILTGNFTENQQSSMLESLGNRFKRDVILNDAISDIQGQISKTTNTINGLGNSSVDKGLKAALQYVINGWQQSINEIQKQQNDITKKYGK